MKRQTFRRRGLTGSIVTHAILIILFILYGFSQHNRLNLPSKVTFSDLAEQPAQTHDIPVQIISLMPNLPAPSPALSAPVSTPTPPPMQTPATPPAAIDQSHTHEHAKMEPPLPDTDPAMLHKAAEPEWAKPLPHEDPLIEKLAEAPTHDHQTIAESSATLPALEQQPKQPKKSSKNGTLTRDQLRHLALKTLLQDDASEDTTNVAALSHDHTISVSTSPFALLTQGLKQSHQQPRTGQTTGTDILPAIVQATNEAFKESSYRQRITAHLLNAYRIVRSSSYSGPLFTTNPASMNIEINKDGSLAEVSLVESSGDPTFDALILKAVRYATPFPPIPSYLGVERFRMCGMVRIPW